MEALTYTYTRQHLAEVMRSVNEDHIPVVVTSQRGKPVVILSRNYVRAAAKSES